MRVKQEWADGQVGSWTGPGKVRPRRCASRPESHRQPRRPRRRQRWLPCLSSTLHRCSWCRRAPWRRQARARPRRSWGGAAGWKSLELQAKKHGAMVGRGCTRNSCVEQAAQAWEAVGSGQQVHATTAGPSTHLSRGARGRRCGRSRRRWPESRGSQPPLRALPQTGRAPNRCPPARARCRPRHRCWRPSTLQEGMEESMRASECGGRTGWRPTDAPACPARQQQATRSPPNLPSPSSQAAPSVSMPHTCRPPASRVTNVCPPATCVGWDATFVLPLPAPTCPLSPRPQHQATPAVSRPHVVSPSLVMLQQGGWGSQGPL